MSKIHDELDRLIKRASAAKTEALQKEAKGPTSAKLDSDDGQTTSAETGRMADDQQRAQRDQYADNANDNSSVKNEPNASVEESTDEATAVAPDGSEGTQGGMLEGQGGGIDEADNGPEDTDSPKNDGWNSGAFKSAADALRKQASDLREAAQGLLSPLDRFLVKAARDTEDEDMKKTAMAMPDDELAAASGDALMGQIEGGDLSDEEAAGILQEALDAGAITEEDIAEAAEAVSGAGDVEDTMPESEGDMAGPGGPVEEEAVEEAVADTTADTMDAAADAPAPVEEEALAAEKLAAAEIGPDDSRYLEKLATFYPDDINAGYAYGIKLAEEMAEGYEEEGEEETSENPSEGGDDESESEAAGSETEIEINTDGGDEDTEEVAEEAVEEVPPEMGEMPPVEEGAPMGDEAMLMAGSPEEQEALQAVQGELGIDDAQLAQLMAAPVPEAAKIAMAKTAEALKEAGVDPATVNRTVILNKVAATRQ